MSRFARQFARRHTPKVRHPWRGYWNNHKDQYTRRQHYVLLTDEKGERRARLGWIDEDRLKEEK